MAKKGKRAGGDDSHYETVMRTLAAMESAGLNEPNPRPSLWAAIWRDAPGRVVRLHLMSGTIITGRYVAVDGSHLLLAQHEDTPLCVVLIGIVAVQILTEEAAAAEVDRWRALKEG